PTAEYQHRIVTPPEFADPPSAVFEAAQLAMFTEFYATACTEEARSPNPYAPCVHNWKMHFLKTPFHSGHILMFSLDQLERIADVISERRALQGAIELVPGLNLIGFAFAEFGIGENLRAFASACAAGGIPFVVNDVDKRV